MTRALCIRSVSDPLMKCNLELITTSHLCVIEWEREGGGEEFRMRLLLLSPTAVAHKFDQLVLRLQFLICVDGAETDSVTGIGNS